jgi:hypothetical protein
LDEKGTEAFLDMVVVFKESLVGREVLEEEELVVVEVL